MKKIPQSLFGVSTRLIIIFFYDALMAFLSVPIALFLRLGDDILLPNYLSFVLPTALLLTLIALPIFWTNKLYQGVWQYASLSELITTIKAVTYTLLVFTLVTFLLARLDGLPRSFLLIEWILLIFLLGGSRLLYRKYAEHFLFAPTSFLAQSDGGRVRILLIGISDKSRHFIDLQKKPDFPYKAVGILDKDNSRIKQTLGGIKILDNYDNLDGFLNKNKSLNIEKIVIADEAIKGENLSNIVEICEKYHLSIAKIPNIADLTDQREGQNNSLENGRLRDIDIEDLLGRPAQKLENDKINNLIKGQTALVTGAGGSIGGEIVRQIVKKSLKRLILLDHSELQLYQIQQELKKIPTMDVEVIGLLTDIQNKAILSNIFNEYRPDIVFHAAALKHVPIAEDNASEAILTNVIGTRNVIQAANSANTKYFVHISTDKAVNPTNLMGASKRIAEQYIQGYAHQLKKNTAKNDNNMRIAIVRFGNVLGSTGSVVPLFKQQIREGGPLTITHPDMVRYFMSIPEAVQLVLQASVLVANDETLALSGTIMILEMGAPVKITDLAHRMIRLSGLTPEKDIVIKYTGIRKGEKLYEELSYSQSEKVTQIYPNILSAAPTAFDMKKMDANLEILEKLSYQYKAKEIIKEVQKQLPDYKPQNQ